MNIKTNNINNYKLYSFDIFDTLLTRTTATPSGIFTIMAKLLLTSEYADFSLFFKENFYTIRKEAEGYVRVNHYELYKKQEITINDIYEIIKLNNNLTDNQIERLINLEIETELNNIKPIKENIKFLKELINNNKRVVLISDMYLPLPVIQNILYNFDSVFKNIKIYLSSKYCLTKHSGDLYDFIQNEEKIDYSNWIHFGDDNIADILQAKHRGIKAVLFKKEEFKPYENIIKQYEDDFYIQSLIGLSRLSRINSDDKSSIYQFACSFASSILYNYVNWILNYAAINNNIDNLYFIARDGYVLKLVADIIIRQKKYNIKTKYIYGSRTAWRIPDENNIDEYINWVCSEYLDKLNLDFLASRLGIDVSKIQKTVKIKDTKKILKSKEVLLVKNTLLQNAEFKNEIIKINKEKKDLLIKYLKQEIDFSKKEVVFVDVNGSGRTQDMLANTIYSFYKGKVLGFYFHIIQNCLQNNSPKISYMTTNKYINFGIELLCRNTDGQTLGYRNENGKIAPMLEKSSSLLLEKWGYYSYLKGLECFCENACDFEIKNNLMLNSYNLYKHYFDYFINDLDKETANIIGSIPYMDVGDEKNVTECAPKYGFLDFCKIFFFLKRDLYTEFISLKRSAPIFSIICNMNEKYGSLRKFLLNVLISKSKHIAYIRFFGIKISIAKLIWKNKGKNKNA